MRLIHGMSFVVAIIAGGMLSACQQPRAGVLPDTRSGSAEHAAGLTLLRQVLDKNSQVDGILMIKSVDSDVEPLIKDIAHTCTMMRDKIDSWVSEDDQLSLEANGLPLAEARARELREDRMTWVLLGASGPVFQMQLLLSQAQAMGYASCLADALRQFM